ncbi:hypothetical protein M1494_02170 [Candidatus Parvarchaeota archaeon]|nr:hypothetical protein [Candidatus Parvarchaeota archaeon]
MKSKPKVRPVFEYALKNIDFYKSSSYRALKNLDSKGLEYTFKNVPVISGESFIDDFYKFIPNIRTNISLFQTSGSTGKPKVIPATYEDIKILGEAFINMYQDLLGSMPYITVNIAPPRPAISGVGMSAISEFGNSIELNPGPGQGLLEILKKCDSILDSHSKMNKTILITGLPSLLFREIYNLDNKTREDLNNLACKNEIYIALGGEPLNLERSRLLYSLISVKGIINLLASTERVCGSKFYTEEMLKSERMPDTSIFKVSRYNNEFGIYSDGKVYYPSNSKLKGIEGELLLTSKGLKGYDHAPLINYNTKEKVRFIGIDKDYMYLEFLGRTNKLVNFSVSKLDDIIIDDVLAFASRKLNLGEGYAEITRENGLDKITFYFYRNEFKGSKEELLNLILDKLSKEEMELKYVIDKKLASLDAELVDKDKIPFYDPKKLKGPKIVDKRGIEHY